MSTSSEPASESSALAPQSVASAVDVNQLAQRVTALETRFPKNSWLFGDNFLKRAFAIYGYSFVAGLIIGLVVWAVVLACFVLFAMLGVAAMPQVR